MKLEKINSSKFPVFNANEIISPKLVFGGYKGETSNNASTGGGADQIKETGKVDSTENGSGKRNDGFN
jgi:hypothetical protein